MNNSQLAKIIGKNISWLQTMKQSKGYAGPVVHYWQDCLNYIGPSLGWAYEGLIISYIQLFEKTNNKKFLDLAIEAGNHLVNNQFSNGSFYNSNFESNPSLRSGGTPHETSASIGLMRLAKKLKELNMNWKPYFLAAKNNLEKFHMKGLFDKKTKLFFQYRWDKKLHVANKTATINELLLLMYNFTNKEKYLNYVKINSDFIISQQNTAEIFGGIRQTDIGNNNKKIITYYTARCIPALLDVYKLTNKGKYLDAALNAGEFIQNMKDKSGGFYFAHIKNKDWELYKYPIWIAGASDIVRALLRLKPYRKFNVDTSINYIFKNINENGSFPTSYGMNLKNKIADYSGKPFWRDILPVVGWNDKALRLYCELFKGGKEINLADINPISIECADASYYEDSKLIKINGNENYVFKKDAYFSNKEYFHKVIMDVGTIYTKFQPRYSKDRKLFDFVLKKLYKKPII